MKRFNRVFALLLAGFILAGGPAKVKAQIEVVDEKTLSVRATGIAEGIKKKKKREPIAFDNALHNAIKLVVNDMLRASEEQAAFAKVSDSFYETINDYVLATEYANKSNFDKPLYRTSIELVVKVNKDAITQKLVALGILSSASDVRKELDRFSIMPYLDLAGSDDEAIQYKELFYTRARVFFEDQGIPTVGEDETAAIEADEEMLAMLKSSSGAEGEEDPALQIARNTPADIFIKITARVETGSYGGATTKKVILTVGAYTVMTGEFIGSSEGISEPLALSSGGASVGAGIDQAMNSAMSKVMDRISGFWRDFVRDGRPIKLIFTDFTFKDMRWVRDSLKELANDQKRLKAAGNVSEYMVWYDGNAEDLMYELYDVFESNGVPMSEDPSMISNTIRFYRQK